MLPWKSIILLQKEGECPVYLQIANAISLEIKKGHLGPGVKLPGTRQLSDLLDVHRITVVRAWENPRRMADTERGLRFRCEIDLLEGVRHDVLPRRADRLCERFHPLGPRSRRRRRSCSSGGSMIGW